MKLLLGFAQCIGVGEEVKAAGIPADGVLGAEAEGGGDLAFADGVVGRRGDEECVGIAGGRVAVDDEVPAGVSGLYWMTGLNGEDAKEPTLADGLTPLVAGADLAGEHYFGAPAGMRRGGQARNGRA